MNTLREYVTTPGRPASASPWSRTRAAEAHRSTRSSPRAPSRNSASVASRATPSRARRSARRSAELVTRRYLQPAGNRRRPGGSHPESAQPQLVGGWLCRTRGGHSADGDRGAGAGGGARAAARLRGVGARPPQVPGRPDRVPRVFARRVDDGFRLSEGGAPSPGRGRAGEVLPARRLGPALPVGVHLARGVGRGRDARTRHRGLGDVRAEVPRRGGTRLRARAAGAGSPRRRGAGTWPGPGPARGRRGG